MDQLPCTASATIRLPDLISHLPFPVSHHPNADAITAASDRWLDSGMHELTMEERGAIHGLKAGQLVAYCYPGYDDERVRVISDFMNFIFHLDDISDGMVTKRTEIPADVVMNALWFPHSYRPTHAPGKEQPDEEIDAGKLARDFWIRCIQDCAPGCQARFLESLQVSFEAASIQARQRANGIVPDLKSYIGLRRDTSGCKPSFDMLEYGARVDLPDFVMSNSIIEAMKVNANDLVSWLNDIFSYNVEQSRGDNHNLVVVVMKELGLTRQGAVDYVEELYREKLSTFLENKKKIPSWGQEIDKDVAAYIHGLENWIVGSTHWSFVSERYFGTNGAEVKRTRLVKILPQRIRRNGTQQFVSVPFSSQVS